MRALLLSGGNSKLPLALYTMRQLRKLHGSEYTLVAGVSCGAIEAEKFAEDLGAPGALDELEALLRQVDGTNFYLHPNTRIDTGRRQKVENRRRAGVMTLAPLRKRLADNVHSGRIPARVACEVGTVDLTTKAYLSVARGAVPTEDAWLDAICASCAEAPVMDWWPVQLRGEAHARPCIDGGFKHVIPDIGERWRQFSAIDVVLHSTVTRENDRPLDDVDDMLEVAGRAAEIWTDGVLAADLARLQRYAWNGVHVTLYAPPVDPRDPFDASRETMRWRLEELGPLVYANGKALDGNGGFGA